MSYFYCLLAIDLILTFFIFGFILMNYFGSFLNAIRFSSDASSIIFCCFSFIFIILIFSPMLFPETFDNLMIFLSFILLFNYLFILLLFTTIFPFPNESLILFHIIFLYLSQSPFYYTSSNFLFD